MPHLTLRVYRERVTTCRRCETLFTVPPHPGRLPPFCPLCKEARQAEPLVRTGECADCSGSFEHHGKRGTLPTRCPDCRPTPIPDTASCMGCGQQFTPRGPGAKYCDRLCRSRSIAGFTPGAVLNCEECSEGFVQRWPTQRFCDPRCRKRADLRRNKPANPVWSEARKARSQERRAQRLKTQTEPIVAAEIFERDGWRCGICRKAIKQRLQYPDPRSASLDHVVPLSLGGTHTRDNVQAAHLRCNISKNNRIVNGVQPMLFG